MQFICSTFGSAGDVFPMLGLALELRSRGHKVVFATNQHFEKLVTEYDLPFQPLGSAEAFAACISHPDLWHPQRSFAHVFKFLQPVQKQQYELYAGYATQNDAVGITNCFGFGAFLVQEKLGLPVFTLHCQPAVIWSDYDPPTLPGVAGPRWLKSLLYRIGERFFIDPVVCPFLNSWRKELGLPPMKAVTRWWNSPTGVLGLFPDWYSKPQPDWPDNVIQTDFPLWNHQSVKKLSAEVQDFLAAGEPPIVFTPGSANIHGRAFFEAAIEACVALGRRGILLTEFPDQLPSPLPPSIVHFSYVPLDALLPKASAFVHHGGVGSASQGLLAGIPQVIMPLAHDQFDNAARLKRLGMGDWIPVKKFAGPNLTMVLKSLFASPSVAASCRAAAERLAPRDGLRRAATAIEEQMSRRSR